MATCAGCGTLLHEGCRREAGACPTLGCVEAARVAPATRRPPRRPVSGYLWTAVVFVVATFVFVEARALLAGPELRGLERTIDAACAYAAWTSAALGAITALTGAVRSRLVRLRWVVTVLVCLLLLLCTWWPQGQVI